MRQRSTITHKWGAVNDELEMRILFGDDSKNLRQADCGDYRFDAAALVSSVDVDTGEDKEVLNIMLDGELYSTISPTFIDDFMTIFTWAEEHHKTVKELSLYRATSKRGREFLRCLPKEMEDLK